jgi:site-specific recombinase XerC
MRQAIEDYLRFLDSEWQHDVAADAREIMAHYKRENLLDFSSFVGAIEPAQLTRKHLAQYAAALDERGTDKVTKDIAVDNARKFLAWLRHRERPKVIGRFIGKRVARAMEWFKRARR